jgi:hypothetical protein
VLGEEILEDQLIGGNNNQMEEEEDDFDPDQLVGPGEEGFPVIQLDQQLPQN